MIQTRTRAEMTTCDATDFTARWRRNLRALLAVAGLTIVSGCAGGASLPYSTAMPPTALVVARDAGISDQRARFRAIFCAIREDHGRDLPFDRPCTEALTELEGEGISVAMSSWRTPSLSRLRVVVVPGIFGECVAPRVLPFQDTASHLIEAHGLRAIEWLPVDGRSSSARNAELIRNWLAAHPTAPDLHLVLIGYSKGASDIMEAVGRFPDAIPPGTSIVSVAGVISGTPLADDWERRYQTAGWLPFPTCGPGDGGGVTSLTRRERMRWLAANPLPPRYKYYALPAFGPRAVISRMLQPFHRQLSSIDERNDGQVLYQDGVFPGGALLGYANADHWAVTLPMARGLPVSRPLVNRNAFPRTVLLEAILGFIASADVAEADGDP